MNPYIFLGPTLPRSVARQHLDARFLPPAEQGDVLRLLCERPAVIGIIDGSFQFVPSLWHKEILVAIEEGVCVYGAASMGALRAAELAPFGMRGVGKVFEMFRSGECEDDDEVAVTFAPRKLGYRPLSEAMIDIRDVCHAAVRRRAITPDGAAAITVIAKRLYFPERTWETIERKAIAAGLEADVVTRLRGFREQYGPGLKQRDAIQMLRRIARHPEGQRRKAPVRVEPTVFLARSRYELSRDAAPDLDAPPGGARDVARKKVLLGMLASKEAARTGLLPTRDDIEGITSWFREQYGLTDDRAFEGWLVKSGLETDRFERGMHRFAAILGLQEATRLQLEEETDDYQQLYGAATDHARDQPRWVQLNVALRRQDGNVQAKGRTLLQHLLKGMPRLRRVGGLLSFHFVRKHPDIRLRFQALEPEERLMPRVDALLRDLTRRKCVASVSRSIYEPESRVFGGACATAAVHEYFHADSVNWIMWAAVPPSKSKCQAELVTTAILSDLFLAAAGGEAEVWDIWHNLYELTSRRGRAAEHDFVERVSLEELVRRASIGERSILRRYRVANRRLAAALHQIVDDGDMTEGIRAVLPFVAMFHCNRFGIDGTGQAALATAMMKAWNPKRTFVREPTAIAD